MLRTLCHAWCAVGRFDDPVASCFFGCGSTDGHAVAHLTVCLVVTQWVAASLPLVRIVPANSVASLIHALLTLGPRAMQHAVYCDLSPWAIDRLRHGRREHPFALLRARPRELVLRHAFCHDTVLAKLVAPRVLVPTPGFVMQCRALEESFSSRASACKTQMWCAHSGCVRYRYWAGDWYWTGTGLVPDWYRTATRGCLTTHVGLARCCTGMGQIRGRSGVEVWWIWVRPSLDLGSTHGRCAVDTAPISHTTCP